MIVNTRGQIVKWALQGCQDKAVHDDFHYLEVRPLFLRWPGPITHDVDSDCSWYVKLCYWKAGAKDPTGLNYSPWGNSDSLYAVGRHIPLKRVKQGDVIVVGPGGSVHAVIVVQSGPDPLCASMGKPGDPSLVRLSVLEGLGEPTFLRFRTLNRRLIPSRKQR